MSNIPISTGSGAASVATEQIGTVQFQQIKVIDGTAASTNVWVVNADGSANIRVNGSVLTTVSQGSSVSGTVGASVIGWVPIQTANTSVISYVQNSVATVIIGGSIAASFTPPANQSVSGTVQTDVRGSIAAVIIGGSIAASFTPPANQSVSGTVQADIRGSVAAVIIGGSIAASFTPPANQSVSGAVQFAGASPASIVTVTRLDNQMLGSMLGFVGQVTLHGITNVGSQQFQDVRVDAGTGAIVASIVGTPNVNTAGSVVAFQGTSPWVVNFQNSSIFTNQTGSVITVWKDSSVLAVPVGSTVAVLQSPSIVGTYAEDAAHTTGDKGLFALQVRNDTMASITSADGDYSPQAVGPVGEVITGNAPITKWIRGTADLRVVLGSSVTAIAAQGASIFTYITGVQVVNFGPSSVIVTLGGGLGSILGYTIAPAGGGSNIYYPNALKTGENSAFTASINGTASVLVSAQGFIAKV